MQTRARTGKNFLQCDHMGAFCKHHVKESLRHMQKASDEKQSPHYAPARVHGADGCHVMPDSTPETDCGVFTGLASITSLFDEKGLNFLADLEMVIELSPLGECEFPFPTKKMRRAIYK